MKENICQVIAKRIHTPDQIIQAERKPGERLVVTLVEGRKHPAQMRPGKTSEVLVFNESLQVVPIDEAVPQSRGKNDEGHEGNRTGEQIGY